MQEAYKCYTYVYASNHILTNMMGSGINDLFEPIISFRNNSNKRCQNNAVLIVRNRSTLFYRPREKRGASIKPINYQGPANGGKGSRTKKPACGLSCQNHHCRELGRPAL